MLDNNFKSIVVQDAVVATYIALTGIAVGILIGVQLAENLKEKEIENCIPMRNEAQMFKGY